MDVHPQAGKPVPPNLLIDVARLVGSYYESRPDVSDPDQKVSFGTSGHRGTSLNGSFNEAHILATTQAICDYRQGRGISGPVFLGKDSHALSTPAEMTALRANKGDALNGTALSNLIVELALLFLPWMAVYLYGFPQFQPGLCE